MGGFVSEHRLTDDVANRKDVTDIGTQLTVDGDEALLVNEDTRGVSSDGMAIGVAADGDEDLVERVGCRRPAPLEINFESRRVRFDFNHLCLEVNIFIALLDAF